ncbi:hypothetical protein [Nocardia sp. NPDC060259]|uniref:hypothetical protein n=1 Tax=Nocardia sp. NPDC060259 TaxID=3347088 RepID=UPI003648F948
MGRMIDIDFHFGGVVDAIELIQSLLKSGVSLVSDGSIRFHLNDDFDWETRPEGDIQEVMAALQVHSEAGDAVGVDVYFDDSSLGGSLLIPAESTVVYFILPNHRAVIGPTEFTDFSWYLERLIQPFRANALSGFECHDFYPR